MQAEKSRYKSICCHIQCSNKTLKVKQYCLYTAKTRPTPLDRNQDVINYSGVRRFNYFSLCIYIVHKQTKNCFGDMRLNCKHKQNTPSVCSLLDRHPVLQVFSNLLPWYSSTAQLCLLLLPFSRALLALTPCFHTSIIDRAHNMGLFRRKEHIRSYE